MKKLAINSFLAVTAMAWLGQSPQLQGASMQWRDQGSHADLNQSAADTDPQLAADDADPALQYTAEHRALLQHWLRQRDAQALPLPGLQRGDRFGVLQTGHIAVLPAELMRQLGDSGGLTMDLAVGEQVVRVMRNSRRVIDTVNS